MATARNTVIQPTTFNIPLPQIPYELLAAKLQEQQSNYDEFGTLSALTPQFLQEHSGDFQKYSQFVDTMKSDVAQEFANGNSGAAMRKLQQAKDALKKQYNPGGLAYALQGAYNADADAKKQLQETFKKDIESGNSINYQLAQSMYKVPELGYNPQTGTFNKPTAPNVPTYFDYTKELQSYIKTMNPAIQKISKIQGDYVWDETGKQYHVPGMMEAFSSDPRVQQQLGINAQYQLASMSPEEKQMLVDNENKKLQQKVSAYENENSQITKLLNSDNKDDRRLGQSMLKEKGLYTGKLDGIVGDKTKEAASQFSSTIEGVKGKEIGVEQLPSLFQNEQLQKLYGYAEAALPDEHSLTINQANWRAKLNAQASKMKEMVQEFQAANTPTAFPILGKAVDINKVTETLKISEDTYNQLKTLLDKFAQANGIQGGAEGLVNALQSTDPAIQKLFADSPAIVGSIQNYQDAAKAKDVALNTKNQLTKIFIENGNGMKMAQEYVKNNKLDKLGVTPEMLIYNPDIARKKVPSVATGYSMEGTTYQENAVDIFRNKFNSELEKDIQSHYDKYRSAIPTGLKDNSEQFKLIEDAAVKSNAFAGIPDVNGKMEWRVLKDGKWVEGKNGIKTNGISIMPTTSAKGGIDVQIEGVDEDGNPATRIAHIDNIEQNQFIKSWASNVIADGLNGKETDANMLVARNISRGIYEPGRVALPENGSPSKVVIDDFEYDKKVNVIKDLKEIGLPQVKLGTYYDRDGNKTYGVFEQVGSQNGLPVLKVRKGLDNRNAVFSENEYDSAWGTFDMEAVMRDPSIRLMEGKRKPSEKTEIPFQQLNLLNFD